MLRLKQAMDELKIPQQAFVTASGWSKTQISLTLNSGKLPANLSKFARDVVHFARNNPDIELWVNDRGLMVENLLDDLGLAEDTPDSSLDLERTLCEIAGRAVLGEGINNLTLALLRATRHLHQTLTGLVGEDAPYIAGVEAETIEILMGVKQ